MGRFSIFARFGIPALLVAFLATTGCNGARGSNPLVIDIKVGRVPARVEIASTPSQRRRGLMYRAKLGANEGMLFVFKRAQPLSFWMKNTLIPLDLAYFDENGILLNVLQMDPEPGVPDHKLKAYPSSAPALYALEMNKGWFKKRGIRKKARLVLSRKVIAAGD